jgi:tetratricopeptide (TPR) repeat protein
MQSYGVSDVARMLQLSRSTIRGLISRGFVAPTRGPRREYRFSFQDLLVLRTARALVQAKVPARRIGRSLNALRRQLPQSVPLSGLTICAVGNDVVVRKGGERWQAESGQYLLELDVSVAGESLRIVEIDGSSRAGLNGKSEARDAAAEAQAWFDLALREEDRNAGKAIEAYERCQELDTRHLGSRINLGRLHHEAGRFAQSERIYREALRACEPDPTLFFNLAVLLEDTSRDEEAVEAYLQALTLDPDFADAHFNLARLYEALGKPRHAIRHLGIYRRLLKS